MGCEALLKTSLAWNSSETLCNLGFQNLFYFNQVMLAKLAWKVWTQPNFLMFNLLKFKYFRMSNILSAKKGQKVPIYG